MTLIDRRHPPIRVTFLVSATLMLLALGVPEPTLAQAAKRAPAKGSKPAAASPKKSSTDKAVPDKVASSSASYEALVMAHRDNLVTLTKALRGSGSPTAEVNVIVARPAIAEMKHTYEQLMEHHAAQMAALGGHMDSATTAAKNRMDVHLGTIGQEIAALDLVINDPTPDAKEVAARSAIILRECAAITAIRAKAVR